MRSSRGAVLAAIFAIVIGASSRTWGRAERASPARDGLKIDVAAVELHADDSAQARARAARNTKKKASVLGSADLAACGPRPPAHPP